MRGLLCRWPYGAAVAIIFLAGCGGSGVLNSASQRQATAANRAGAGPRNISGEYAGTITDNQTGTSSATAALAQYGSSVGGPLTFQPSPSVTASVAFTTSGNDVNGTLVIPGATACAFSTSATYDASSRHLNGSYSAIYGCTGESGTYSLKRKCSYRRAGDGFIERQSGPRPC